MTALEMIPISCQTIRMYEVKYIGNFIRSLSISQMKDVMLYLNI